MAKGGSSKGFPFERKISKELSLWISGGEHDSGIWRTKGSGGRGTNRRKKGVVDPYDMGDLTFDHPRGKPLIDTFLFELKKGRGKELDILDIVDRKPKKHDPPLIQWWRKAEEERKQAERPWIQIIIERDRKNACVVLDEMLLFQIEEFNQFDFNCLKIKWEELNLCLFPYDLFYKRITPDRLEFIRSLRKPVKRVERN